MKAFAAAAATLFIGACGARVPAPVAAQVEPAGITMGTWRAVDAGTSQLTELPALEELAGQFPDSATVQVRYFNALVRAGEAQRAYALLDRIQARGYRFSQGGEAQINAFFAANGYDKPLSLTQRAGDVHPASTLVATIPAEIRLVESVLRASTSGHLYASSIVSRGLFRQRNDGGWERVELGPVGSLAGLLQAADGIIWAASAVFDPTPDPEGAFRGVIGYDPATSSVRRLAISPGANPGDIALGPDGSIFAADPATGAIYRAYKHEDRLYLLVAPGTFRSAQGMAVSADGRFLYVSDYGYGLALVDLHKGGIDHLPAPHSLFVDGTDGLWLHDGHLIAVQNGARPPRIVAHRLAPDGRSILDTRVLESAHPSWAEPAGGSIDGDRLLYVATGQWDRFAKGGGPIDGKPPLPTDIRALELREMPAPPPKKQG